MFKLQMKRRNPTQTGLVLFVNSLLHSELLLNQYVYCVHLILIPLLVLDVFMH